MNVRKDQRFVGVVAVISLALLAGWIAWRRPANPVVRGRLASEWTADLLSPEYQVRGEAQAALLMLGEEAVPEIRVLLQQRVRAWESLANRFGSSLPFLRSKGADPTLCRRRGAEMISLLEQKGRAAVPELIDTLRYAPAANEAQHALLRVGDAAVEGLVSALRSRYPAVRAQVAHLLKEFPAHEKQYLPPVIARTRDEDFRVRREAAFTLGGSACSHPVVIAALLPLTLASTAEVRAEACRSLGALGERVPEVMAGLSVCFQDVIAVVRLEAAKSFWSLGGECGIAIRVLEGVLPTQEGWQAAYALGRMGPAAAPAVPALIEALKREKVPRVFRTPPSSSFALGQIREPAIPALLAVLEHPQPEVRLAAVLAFNFMGSHALSAVPELQKLLGDPDPEIRQVTAITLASAGAERELVLSSLAECLNAEDIYIRSMAAELLRKIAPDQNWAVASE